VSTALAAALVLAARSRSRVTMLGVGSSLSVRQHLTGVDINRVRGLMGKDKAVRQWAPVKIPASKRRKREDRIRFELFSNECHQLLETFETLQAYVAEHGGDLEGPMVQPSKRHHIYLNKSPNGHSHSKYKWDHWEFYWLVDFYPPAEGGLAAVMKMRFPHRCRVRIV
jgi:ribosomal protein S10